MGEGQTINKVSTQKKAARLFEFLEKRQKNQKEK